MAISRLLIGIPMVVLGFVLLIIPAIFAHAAFFVSWIYALPLIGIGIALLLNKNEDVIEQINKKVKGGKK